MNRTTFASAMEKLGEQANEEQLREMERERRHKIFSVVRRWLGFVIFAGLLTYGYLYREPLQDLAYDKFFAPAKSTPAEKQARATIGQVQAQAEKRDKILEEITK
jgi:hypothetical protein